MGLTSGLLCLTAALVAGNAFLGIAYPKASVHAAEFCRSSRRKPRPRLSRPPRRMPSPHRLQPRTRASSRKNILWAASSYIDAMKAAGTRRTERGHSDRVESAGRHPEYIREMNAQGIHPDANRLIA